MVDKHTTKDEPVTPQSEFEQLGDGENLSLLGEFWFFLRENKKWWLAPIFIVLAVAGLLVALTATGAAPFIYALF